MANIPDELKLAQNDQQINDGILGLHTSMNELFPAGRDAPHVVTIESLKPAIISTFELRSEKEKKENVKYLEFWPIFIQEFKEINSEDSRYQPLNLALKWLFWKPIITATIWSIITWIIGYIYYRYHDTSWSPSKFFYFRWCVSVFIPITYWSLMLFIYPAIKAYGEMYEENPKQKLKESKYNRSLQEKIERLDNYDEFFLDSAQEYIDSKIGSFSTELYNLEAKFKSTWTEPRQNAQTSIQALEFEISKLVNYADDELPIPRDELVHEIRQNIKIYEDFIDRTSEPERRAREVFSEASKHLENITDLSTLFRATKDTRVEKNKKKSEHLQTLRKHGVNIQNLECHQLDGFRIPDH